MRKEGGLHVPGEEGGKSVQSRREGKQNGSRVRMERKVDEKSGNRRENKREH